jgi:molecular chaperone DnaK (HSP70)
VKSSKAAVIGALALLGCSARGKSSLGEALAVEQPGGTVAQLVAQGSELPTSATESFTNGRDEESKLFFHVLRGPGRTAEKLRSDGWYTVDGFNTGKAGQARVLVTFDVDAQGALKVSAREDERKLSVHKMETLPERKPTPAPLTEPDDGSDLDQDPE